MTECGRLPPRTDRTVSLGALVRGLIASVFVAAAGIALPVTTGSTRAAAAPAGAAVSQAHGGAVRAPAAGLPPLVLIGGGKDDPELMRLAIGRAGGPEAKVAILALASRDPPRSGAAYLEFLRELGIGARTIQIPNEKAAADAATAAALRGSTLLFFSGGDQSRIVGRLRHTAALAAIGEAWRRGAVLAGTSAGAMPWGSLYIAGGSSVEAIEKPSALDLRPGLAIAGALLVDTHFTTRGRLGRLLVALASRPGALALGIDEGTAAVLDGGLVTAAGEGGVAVVEGANLSTAIRQPFSAGPFRLHRLTAGYSVPLPSGPLGSRRPATFPSATPPPDGPRDVEGPSVLPPILFDAGVWTPGGVERLLRNSLLAGKGVGVGLTALATASFAAGQVRVHGGPALVLDTTTATEFAVPATPSAVFVRDVWVSVVSPGVPYDLTRHAPAPPMPAPRPR